MTRPAEREFPPPGDLTGVTPERGRASEPDRVSEWNPEWGPQLETQLETPFESGEDLGQHPESDENKDDGNVTWTIVSGAASLGIGVWGILTGDGFSTWSLLLIGVGASAIINGLRKMGKGSGE